jgi:phage repressor protein C with HTH and peptisase S24 domain
MIDARERLGMNQETLGNKLGLTKSSVSQWEQGHKIPKKYLPELTKILGVSERELNFVASEEEDADLTIPMFPAVYASPVYDTGSNQSEVEWIARPRNIVHARAFAVNVTGESMNPYILNGDRLYCYPIEYEEQLPLLTNNTIVVVSIYQDSLGTSTQVGRFHKVDDKTFTLRKDNPQFEAQRFDMNADLVPRMALVKMLERKV